LKAPDTIDLGLVDGADFGAALSLTSAFENAYLRIAKKPMVFPRFKRPQIVTDEASFADLLPSVSSQLAST
jgi:hypothetical protein